MTLPTPTYDLVLLLDPQAEESVRTKIIADTRATIEAHGELLRHDEWGERPLTYPIEKKTSAEYHLLQFHTGAVELLGDLDRTLRITDGVMRLRLIKLRRGVPDAPDMRSASAPARRAETETPAETPPPVEAEVEVELAISEPA
jgi:small subunit ribosomal protein S6